MTQPPYGPDGRPQDTPRSFPNYARPNDDIDATQPVPASDPTQPLPVQPPPPQAGWAAPGQPTTPPAPQPSPYGQPQQPPPPYGQPQQPPPPYGQPPQQAYLPPYGQVGYPPQYGYGYPAQTGSKTNGFAIAAIACGLGGLATAISAPFGVGFGIAALVQLKKRPHEDGKGLAITGIISGALITVFYVALFAGIAALGIWAEGQDDYDGAPYPGSSPTYSGTYIEDLAVGECFDDGNNDGEVTRKDCVGSHDGEIVSNVTLPDGAYPGDRKMDQTGETRCAGEFTSYVGKNPQQSIFKSGWWTPSEDSWIEDDDRLLVCAAYGDDETITGSVKGTKR